MTALYNNVLKSYLNPNKSFYYPLEHRITAPREHFVNNRYPRKIREQTYKHLRNLLLKTQKYILQEDFLKEVYKSQGKPFVADSIIPPYDNMWIEYSTDFAKRTELYEENVNRSSQKTDSQGFHITIYAKTKETDLYLITPYRTNLYITDMVDEKTPIKILAPFHCILFSTNVALTDEDYWSNYTDIAHVLKPKNYSTSLEKWLWGKDNYAIMKQQNQNILNHLAIRPSTFGFNYDAPCYMPFNQEGQIDFKWQDIEDKRKHEYKFQDSFKQHKFENKVQVHNSIGIVLAILANMNEVHNIRETKFLNNRLDKSKNTKFYHEFKTLTINPNIKNINDYKQRLESHHKNRYHSVRGHWRHYKSGKRIWIKNFDRGDESLGVIEKQYKVVGH